MAFPRLPRAALYATALAALALAYWRCSPGRARPWTSCAVRTAALTQTVVVSGRVLAPAQVDVGATITGRVQTVAVDEGDHVEAGQVLIELERAELAAALAQAVATEQAAATRIAQWRDVASVSAREQLVQSEANYRSVERDAARQEQLFKQGFIGEARVDEARRAAAVAKSQYETARAVSAAMRRRGRSPPARRPAGAGTGGEGDRGGQARADHAPRPAGGRRPRSRRRARRHRAARQAAAHARARRRGPPHRADRREEPRGAARRPGARACRPTPIRTGRSAPSCLPVARDRRAARHRRGQVRRSRAAAVPALRHDGVDRHRGRGTDRRARRAGRRGARVQSRRPWVLVVRDGRAVRQPVQLGARTAAEVEVLSGLAARCRDRHGAGRRGGRARAQAVTRSQRDVRRCPSNGSSRCASCARGGSRLRSSSAAPRPASPSSSSSPRSSTACRRTRSSACSARRRTS